MSKLNDTDYETELSLYPLCFYCNLIWPFSSCYFYPWETLSKNSSNENCMSCMPTNEVIAGINSFFSQEVLLNVISSQPTIIFSENLAVEERLIQVTHRQLLE